MSATQQRKGFDPVRFAQSLTDALNRPWGYVPPGMAGCAHHEHVSGCVFCALEQGHRNMNEKMLRNLLTAERERIREAARERIDARKEQEGMRRGKSAPYPLRTQVEDVLHAAGVVEIRLGMAVPLPVYADGTLGRALRDDQVCEIVQQAERVLKAAGGFRTHVAWDRDPPVLYVGRVPVLIGFGL